MNIEYYQDDLPKNHPFLAPGFSKELAIDTETMGLVPGRDRLCLVQLAAGDGTVVLVHFPSAGGKSSPHLKKVFENPAVGKIFHYARFDLTALMSHFEMPIRGDFYCTKIASKLARTYTDKHGLKDLTKELLGVEISKASQCSDWGGSLLSEDQKVYAATDVYYLHALKEKLTEMLQRENRWDFAQELFYFLPLLPYLDSLGFKIEDILTH